MPLSNQHNPIQQEEELIPILLQNKGFIATSKKSLENYKQNAQSQTTPKPNLNFNLSHFMSYNFTHFTRFSIAGLSLFTVLAGGVATQALAPDNLKPTQVVQSIKDKYFGVNKQSDPDPQVALVLDSENAVGTLEGCNLLLKYPKKIKNTNIEYLKSTNSAINSFNLYEISNDSTKTDLLSIYCAESKNQILGKNFSLNVITEKKTINSDEIKSRFGWFITDEFIPNIEEFTTIVNNKPDRQDLEFEYKNIQYKISYLLTPVEGSSILDSKNLQLQFTNKLKDIDANLAKYPCTDSLVTSYDTSLIKYKNANNTIDYIAFDNFTSSQNPEDYPNSASFSIKCFYNRDGKAWDEINTSVEKIDTNNLPFIKSIKSTENIKQSYVHPSEKSSFYYIELKDGKILEINFFNIKEVNENFKLLINL